MTKKINEKVSVNVSVTTFNCKKSMLTDLLIFHGKVYNEGKEGVIFLQNMLAGFTCFVVEGQRNKRCWKCFLKLCGSSSVFYRYCLSHLC